VALKRELQNIDYEHLWLELSGVEFGNLKIPKIDLRIGASMILSNGFSRHPKFEFPLINRKEKPFESWYPESHDDQGPKYEVRYDLDRKIFDLVALKKLSNVDSALVLNLILLTPKMVDELIAQRVAIHRPWANWSNLVQETSQITNLLLKNLQRTTDQVSSKESNSPGTAGAKEALVSEALMIGKTKNKVKVTKKLASTVGIVRRKPKTKILVTNQKKSVASKAKVRKK
jgi:hypothetical protein